MSGRCCECLSVLSILLVMWQVADRGYYELKPEYWKEFDPLFAHYYVNEMEEAEVNVFCTILGWHNFIYIYLCTNFRLH